MKNMTLDTLVEQLRKAYGDTLRAVVLFGSAAAGEHNPKRSDYNVLVIVDGLGLGELRAASAVARAWTDGGNPPPLTLTTDEWRGSADVFSMEYADILERHRVLHGELPVEGIRVAPRYLRLQLEREAMGKMLRFRQGILAAGNEPKRQIELLEASLSTMMVIFRSVLRLHGETPPADYEALTERITTRTGLDGAPFLRVVRHVRGGEKLASAELEGVLAGYLTGLRRVVEHVDRFTPAE